MQLISAIHSLLWGDLFMISLPVGGQISISLKTIFNMMAILPMGSQSVKALDEYMTTKKRS